MKKLLTKLVSGKLSTYAAITLTFTYTILLNRNFDCTCKSQGKLCNVYMGLPFFIILLLILLTDGSFQRVCRYLCSCSAGCCMPTTCNFCGSFFLHILKAALVSLLWVAFVYLEGDWYVCCENDHSEQQAALACKAKDNITEKERVIIAELKNHSRVIGGIILSGVVLLASLMPLCQRRKCCEGKSSCCNRRFLYYELILEEEDNVLKEIWRKLAKDQLTIEVVENINNEKWEQCFDVAVNQINASAIPMFKKQEAQLINQELKKLGGGQKTT